MERKVKEGLKRLAFLSLFFLGVLGYEATNRINVVRDIPRTVVDTPLDALIPLVPVFVVPYLFLFVYVGAALLILFFDRSDRYYRMVLSFFVGMGVATLVFYFFPTYMPRPVLVGTGPFVSALRWVYSMDSPFNCLPSTHVLYSTIAFWHLYRWRPRARAFQLTSLAILLLICASTVLVKQHNTPDIPTGFALAMAVSLLFEIPRRGVDRRRSAM